MSNPVAAIPHRVSFLLLYPPDLSVFAGEFLQQLEYCGLKGHVAGCELSGASLRADAREAIGNAFHAMLLFGTNVSPADKQLGEAIEIQRKRRDGFHLFPVLMDEAQLPAMRREGAKEFRDRTLRVSSSALIASLPAFMDGLIPGWTRAHYLSRYWALEELLRAGEFATAAGIARTLCEKAAAAEASAYEQAMVDIPMSRVLLSRALSGLGEREESLQLLSTARDEMLAVLGRESDRKSPSRPVVLIEIADAMLDIKMVAEAAVTFEEAVAASLEEDDAMHAAIARGQLAQVLVSQKKYAEAIALSEQVRDAFAAMNDDGMLSRAWRQLGQIHQQASQTTEAEHAFTAALRLNPDPELATTLAQLCAKQDRLRDAAQFSLQAASMHASNADLEKERDARVDASRYFAKSGAADEARAEIERIERHEETLGEAGQPWKVMDARQQLEIALGNAEAAAEAKRKATETFLAFRRKRGENDLPSGEIANFVVFAVAGGSTEAAAKQLEHFLQNPDLPANAKAYVGAIREVVGGSRDRSLAEHPDLN
ncbi:MAG: tetratricopeptide repeat protein, partial [Bryobacterales bacterium]|nr:tetratricopeptide repeat protein [Bryobacterales bacterium]